MKTTTPPTPHQKVAAEKLVKGDTILFNGGTREIVRTTERKRGNELVVITDLHPQGIVAGSRQAITILPR